MPETQYAHGYSAREADRLADQANALSELLHDDTAYPSGSLVLECGCGTGAQTVHLAARSPRARIVSVDISADSLDQARTRIEAAGYGNVEFQTANLFDLPFDDEHFDHVFVCFVLEHLPDPAAALRAIGRVLRRGGTITAIEGDHGSWYCYPQTPESSRAVECLVELIESGIEADQRKQLEFFDLAERFRAAKDPEEVKRLGDRMGRMVFGD